MGGRPGWGGGSGGGGPPANAPRGVFEKCQSDRLTGWSLQGHCDQGGQAGGHLSPHRGSRGWACFTEISPGCHRRESSHCGHSHALWAPRAGRLASLRWPPASSWAAGACGPHADGARGSRGSQGPGSSAPAPRSHRLGIVAPPLRCEEDAEGGRPCPRSRSWRRAGLWEPRLP